MVAEVAVRIPIIMEALDKQIIMEHQAGPLALFRVWVLEAAALEVELHYFQEAVQVMASLEVAVQVASQQEVMVEAEWSVAAEV